LNLEKRTSVRVVLRLAGGHAAGRGAVVRIEHLPTRRSFGGVVNLVWLGIWKGRLGGRPHPSQEALTLPPGPPSLMKVLALAA
jgi:hypothetical protein